MERNEEESTHSKPGEWQTSNGKSGKRTSLFKRGEEKVQKLSGKLKIIFVSAILICRPSSCYHTINSYHTLELSHKNTQMIADIHLTVPLKRIEFLFLSFFLSKRFLSSRLQASSFFFWLKVFSFLHWISITTKLTFTRTPNDGKCSTISEMMGWALTL